MVLVYNIVHNISAGNIKIVESKFKVIFILKNNTAPIIRLKFKWSRFKNKENNTSFDSIRYSTILRKS